MKERGQWIWSSVSPVQEYNQFVRFRRNITFQQVTKTEIRITADSQYRLFVNGVWLGDGPSRAYPEHLKHDRYDITNVLVRGDNEVEVVVRYFGIGTFIRIPLQAGLWAEVDNGTMCIGTNADWMAAVASEWQRWTPKVSIQMEAFEVCDGSKIGNWNWRSAVVTERPQHRISERKTGMLIRSPRRPESRKQCIVRHEPVRWCVPVAQIAFPGLIEANHHTGCPVVLGSVLSVNQPSILHIEESLWHIAIDGISESSNAVYLSPGRHTVVCFYTEYFSHNKYPEFPYKRPLSDCQWGEWHVAVIKPFLFNESDREWIAFNESAKEMRTEWRHAINAMAALWKDASDPFPFADSRVDIPENRCFLEDVSAAFAYRNVIAEIRADNDTEVITVFPASDGDIELCYDFGEEVCGYFDFEVDAPSGTIIDIHSVEYVSDDGQPQHTYPDNRNGMRYISRAGRNCYTSLKRRSGRYAFLTLRKLKSPVTVRSFQIIESIAPVHPVAIFSSSDAERNAIWKASERTLRLCSEDTFTDCPLYEQTLWIGDARNAALYSGATHGDRRIIERSLELGAESLERFPIVASQVPSCWECMIPAWSFLWGIAVWEHYFRTGDSGWLRELWPSVNQNLNGARSYIDSTGLFSARMWNLFDWADIDYHHPVVLHNSMLLVGAFRAAESCANALGEQLRESELKQTRDQLTNAINAHWDWDRKAYPDAIQESGTPSRCISQHTSMLAITCGVATGDIVPDAIKNLLDPPSTMTRIQTPFALQFLFEAYEIAGELDAVCQSIHRYFAPMLQGGTGTVWEMLPQSPACPPGFPTRSHCHAWSASPLWFFNRITLGIRQTIPGGAGFEISPLITSLKWARGGVATPLGILRVAWERNTTQIAIHIDAPQDIAIKVVPNPSFDGLPAQITRGTT